MAIERKENGGKENARLSTQRTVPNPVFLVPSSFLILCKSSFALSAFFCGSCFRSTTCYFACHLSSQLAGRCWRRILKKRRFPAIFPVLSRFCPATGPVRRFSHGRFPRGKGLVSQFVAI